MVFIETPASRAAWKTAAGVAETGAGSSVPAVQPIPIDDSRTNPIRQKATQPPISTLADRPGSAIPARAPGTPKQASYSSSLSCIPVQYPRGGGDFQADFMRLADPLLWCMRNCGKDVPGDTSRRYPHLRQFQGARRKRPAVDGETCLNSRSPPPDCE